MLGSSLRTAVGVAMGSREGQLYSQRLHHLTYLLVVCVGLCFLNMAPLLRTSLKTSELGYITGKSKSKRQELHLASELCRGWASSISINKMMPHWEVPHVELGPDYKTLSLKT